MRGLTLYVALLASGLAGCVELGVVTDGTSVSVGRPSNGYLRDGHRLPDRGEGFMTRDVWKQRGNRFGTDELLDLLTGVGRRLATHKGPRLVVADLSGPNGGESRKWHRSHQSGRDVDLVYFVRDAKGAPVEADSMRIFDPQGKAKDGSGITVDIGRTWLLVKELVFAHEATVQWVFMYEPIAAKVLEYALSHDEPEALVARVRLALKQPGDSAPHNDHMHVRVYCSDRDRYFGCMDIGPMELLALREADRETVGDYASIVASLIGDAARTIASEVLATPTMVASTTTGEAAPTTAPAAVDATSAATAIAPSSAPGAVDATSVAPGVASAVGATSAAPGVASAAAGTVGATSAAPDVASAAPGVASAAPGVTGAASGTVGATRPAPGAASTAIGGTSTVVGGTSRAASAIIGGPSDLPTLGQILRRPFDHLLKHRWR